MISLESPPFKHTSKARSLMCADVDLPYISSFHRSLLHPSSDSGSSDSHRLASDRAMPDTSIAKLGIASSILLSDSNTDTKSDSSSAYHNEIAKACGTYSNEKILSFDSHAPISKSKTAVKIKEKTNNVASRLNNNRRILTNPDRILDAPGLLDDFYLNLMDWSADNTLAVALERNVYLWDASSGDVTTLCETANNSTVSSIKWSQDGAYLSIASSDGDVQIWDVQSRIKVRSMIGRQDRAGTLSWNNHILSSGGQDGSIWHHDVRISDHKIAQVFGHTGEVCGLTWRSDGGLLASGGNDNLVNIWDIRSNLPKFTKSNHTAAVKALDWCPWQLNVLATGGGTSDKHIHFWNTSTTYKVSSIKTDSQVTSLRWSKNYKEISSTHGFPDNSVTVWSYPDLNKVISIPAHNSRILHSALSPDGQTLATIASDENLKFWRLFEHIYDASGALKTPILSSAHAKTADLPDSTLNKSTAKKPKMPSVKGSSSVNALGPRFKKAMIR
ncbi:hypothetical protein BB560_000118 [Smittium megazygosporum]|uniref:CDC20/Fizzy WD40 domain-containing protein n=1 Tax=Smittium megazygosporum TaxID=133381 RepID=A0A2T9ZL91_9FUNG|nr:hypothetical protein BB560_000118 [Smittium megazygosporum]